MNKQMQIVALNTELLDAYRNKRIVAGNYFAEGWYWDANDENGHGPSASAHVTRRGSFPHAALQRTTA